MRLCHFIHNSTSFLITFSDFRLQWIRGYNVVMIKKFFFRFPPRTNQYPISAGWLTRQVAVEAEMKIKPPINANAPTMWIKTIVIRVVGAHKKRIQHNWSMARVFQEEGCEQLINNFATSGARKVRKVCCVAARWKVKFLLFCLLCCFSLHLRYVSELSRRPTQR